MFPNRNSYQGKEEPEKIELELDDAKYESSEEDEAKEEEEPHTPVLRRSVRERRKPERYSPPDFPFQFFFIYY
jgi:hypothetical protein